VVLVPLVMCSKICRDHAAVRNSLEDWHSGKRSPLGMICLYARHGPVWFNAGYSNSHACHVESGVYWSNIDSVGLFGWRMVGSNKL